MFRRLHMIVLPVLIIGLLNIYETIKNINIYDMVIINDKNIIILILISVFFFLIFYFFKSLTLELELILILSFIGINILLISNDIIIFFLALELYSLSVYLLVYKTNKPIISLIYFIIGSISSILLLLSIAFLYLHTGSLDLIFILEFLNTFLVYHNTNILPFFLSFFIFILLFKLGSAPFQYWVIRIYSNMDFNIILYQSIIPKIVYIVILLSIFKSGISENNIYLIYIILIPSFLSLFIGSIGPLIHKVKHYKTIMAYSSIYNTGFLLLGVASYGFLLKNGINNIVNIIEYLLIYSINTLHLFISFLIPFSPYFFISLLISVFSFIGIPPFAGFFAKLNIIYSSINCESPIFFLGVIIMLLTTLIASFFYLKFINSIYFNKNIIYMKKENFSENIYYLYSLLTILLVLYPLISSFLNPFFLLFSF